ncbi:MAG: hypothetical protein AAGF12_06665 [Myxococcota bacterium]
MDLVNGRFKATSLQDLDDAIAAWQQSSASKHLVVHFHGGLVGRESGWTICEGLTPVYQTAGGYPFFVLWNSGLLTTIKGNLGEIAEEVIFTRLVRKLGQLVAAKLREATGTRGTTLSLDSMREVPSDLEALRDYLAPYDSASLEQVGELSELQRDQIENELKSDKVVETESQKIANWTLTDEQREALATSRGVGSLETTATKISADILDELRAEAPEPGSRGIGTVIAIARYGVKIAVAVIKRLLSGRGHGVYGTIVEEVLRSLYLDYAGRLVWSAMKKDTADSFGTDPSVQGGHALVERIAPHLSADTRLTLVGHSTGAIYIAHFLDALDARAEPSVKADVAFLAPACTFEFLHARLDLLKRRVAGFRLFSLSEPLESGYWEVPVLYPASLLYLVSGVCEDEPDAPIVGMQRYFGQSEGPYAREDIRQVGEWMAEQDRVWSVKDNGLGRSTSARTHGAFDEDSETRESLAHVIEHGFD